MKDEQRVFPANPLVFAELDERRARYERRAAEVRGRWRTLSHGPLSLRLGKQARHLEQMAECYAQLVEAARKLEAEAWNNEP